MAFPLLLPSNFCIMKNGIEIFLNKKQFFCVHSLALMPSHSHSFTHWKDIVAVCRAIRTRVKSQHTVLLFQNFIWKSNCQLPTYRSCSYFWCDMIYWLRLLPLGCTRAHWLDITGTYEVKGAKNMIVVELEQKAFCCVCNAPEPAGHRNTNGAITVQKRGAQFTALYFISEIQFVSGGGNRLPCAAAAAAVEMIWKRCVFWNSVNRIKLIAMTRFVRSFFSSILLKPSFCLGTGVRSCRSDSFNVRSFVRSVAALVCWLWSRTMAQWLILISHDRVWLLDWSNWSTNRQFLNVLATFVAVPVCAVRPMQPCTTIDFVLPFFCLSTSASRRMTEELGAWI